MGLFDWVGSFLGGKGKTPPSGASTPAHPPIPVNQPTQKPSKPQIKSVEKPNFPTLKPNGRRLSIRASSHYGESNRGKPEPVISPRTGKLELKDLETDDAQLTRLGLPVWQNLNDVAADLKMEARLVYGYSTHRIRQLKPHYLTFAVKKRSGALRVIHAPKKTLKALLRKLNEVLVNKLPVSPHAHGFLKKRSIATNACQHVGKPVVIKLDIQDCFPSIRYSRVLGYLIGVGYGYLVARALAVMLTEAPRQPVEWQGTLFHVPTGPRVCVQGSPTSPGICNAILRRLDFRMAGLARKNGFVYSRYADDLVFSGTDLTKAKKIITLASRIAREERLPVNPDKTKVMRSGQRQKVTGVTVNETMGLSRKERRRLRAALHQQSKSSNPDPKKKQQIDGKMAYLRMVNPDQAKALLSKK